MTKIMVMPFNEKVWMNGVSEFKHEVERIMEAKPVKNLTMQEVVCTLRLLELHAILSEGSRNEVVIRKNDERLELCDSTDRFLAMLADCNGRWVLLTTKICIRNFGGTSYHWRKIAHQCPIIDVASAISECGSGYYGRGWVVAPHICSLRKWILETTNYSRIIKLTS